MRWLKQRLRWRGTMQARLAILERKLDERDSEIQRLEATVRAYVRGASGRRPGCAVCGHLLPQHRGPHNEGRGCAVSGCGCLEYDSSGLVSAG